MPELCTGKLVRTVPRGVALSNGRCLLYYQKMEYYFAEVIAAARNYVPKLFHF
jgi:hypothetical protein